MTDKNKAAEQVEILAPDVTMTIAGREFTMREPSWLESLELETALAPVIEDLREMTNGDEQNADVFVHAIMTITGKHKDVLLDMMAFCASVERSWIETLSDSDGRTLMLLFWRVNRGFFFRRLSLARALAAKSAAPAGAKSAQH